ncbi:MAG: RES family NAD+ phosphorylase [Burkholderiales bacterium]|nr:RES family NAD+ phosphorylase [Burkholderiales bacterium]
MTSLPLPPRDLASQPLRTIEVAPAKLYRISRYGSGEPFFGRSASNRFDDPSRVKARRYGTCYLGLSLEVAIAETVLHDEMPVKGRFEVAAAEIETRYCARFKGNPLVLIDLTGAALKSMVGSSAISTIVPYDIPQRWSRALARHPVCADGLLYMSRHVNSERAVVVFDRASAKLGEPTYSRLPDTKGALRALLNLRVSASFA